VGPVASANPEAELKSVDVDVAVVDLCSRFVPGMVKRGRGAVLNVASVGAFGPVPGQASYGAAKAFVLSYTQAMREELRGTGVTAATLCQGPVKTGFGELAGIADEEAEKSLPKFMWEDADAVAMVAVDGLASGKGVIVPRVSQPDRVGGQPLSAATAVAAARRAQPSRAEEALAPLPDEVDDVSRDGR
jgi:short-subunit dehydrogenase